MPTISIAVDSNPKRALLAAAGVLVAAATVYVCMGSLGSLVGTRIDSAEVADLAVRLAPGDPQTHFGWARFYEATFEANDTSAAALAFETSAAISPNNYAIWMAVARLRETLGNRDSAESALRRASALAPAYARVRWALGNLLLRKGADTDAFFEMRLAAAGDAKYAQPLVLAARQAFGDDTDAVRAAIGDVPAAIAALSIVLANEKRFDQAIDTWQVLSAEQAGENAESAKQLLAKLLEGKRFADAVGFDVRPGEPAFAIGQIYNGGFESDISTQNASPFEWQISDGAQPQVALTNGQKRSGERSLLVIFRPTPGKEFRTVSQTVAVVPGVSHRFEMHYRTDIQTTAKIKWEIVSASDGRPLAATEPLIAAKDWTRSAVQFTVPAGTDGIIIRLAREDCPLPACIVGGNLWLDDFVLTAGDARNE